MSLCDIGIRHACGYRDQPMYVFVGDKSMSISMVAFSAEEHTLEMLDIIGVLVTMLMEEAVDKERISGGIWECSRSKGSLGDTLSLALIK